ncbi:Hypothetical protein HVR_LOCUS910 [uncultured virus]|nr:Hypothetical protein HVR_LOCUS910 [uncultured virus]
MNTRKIIQKYSDERLEDISELEYDDLNYACKIGNMKAVKYMIEIRAVPPSSNHLTTANRHGQDEICDYLEPHLLAHGVSSREIRIAYL